MEARSLPHYDGVTRPAPTGDRSLTGRLRDVRRNGVDLPWLSWSKKDGIAPWPFVTRSTASAWSGCASSRFGPIVPVVPAAASVWQLPQPASAKISARPWR